jgi:hypothetical protein
MFGHNLGASPMANYEVKTIDTDYFAEQSVVPAGRSS